MADRTDIDDGASPATGPAGAPAAAEMTPSPNAAIMRLLPGGILEVGFVPGTVLTAPLIRQLSTAAVAAAESSGVRTHLLINVSALDGVDPSAGCVLGASSGISRIAFLGSGPADRVTTRFVTADLLPGTGFRYVQDREEALRYLERNG